MEKIPLLAESSLKDPDATVITWVRFTMIYLFMVCEGMNPNPTEYF